MFNKIAIRSGISKDFSCAFQNNGHNQDSNNSKISTSSSKILFVVQL